MVKNERRQSYENAPYGPSSLALLDTMFPAGHPYHGAVIGSMKDLTAASLADVTDFFRAYYSPANATLCLAGDFDPVAAKSSIQKYFGTLTGRARPPRKSKATPPLKKAVRLVVDEPVELSRVAYGWIAPPAYTPDDPALDVTMAVLAGGRATRLYRKLVVEKSSLRRRRRSTPTRSRCMASWEPRLHPAKRPSSWRQYRPCPRRADRKPADRRGADARQATHRARRVEQPRAFERAGR